jgi:hypothetical protein
MRLALFLDPRDAIYYIDKMSKHEIVALILTNPVAYNTCLVNDGQLSNDCIKLFNQHIAPVLCEPNAVGTNFLL